jgi:hypothetical protein
MNTIIQEFYTDELPLSKLQADPGRVLGDEAAAATLHFCSPAHGGWGVVRVALLVPESYLLFVCPAACGRHGAIAAIEQGYRNRIGYLCITDNEIVLGDYEMEIERGVREVMEKVNPRPKALMIFTSCIDDLLGTDHTATMTRMEVEHHIPIRHARMNPISMGGKLPPEIRVQKTMYEFLPLPDEKDLPPEDKEQRSRGIIMLGAYRPPGPDSELGLFLRSFGFGPPEHPGYCGSFDSFKALAKSSGALLLRPEGKAAGEYLNEKLGIPVLPAFMSFHREGVLEGYRRIAAFLQSLDRKQSLSPQNPEVWFRPAGEELAELARKARSVLGDAAVAVDFTATAAPFSLALALVQAGINVNRIYTPQLPDYEKPCLVELARIRGDIITANPSHARKYGKRPKYPLSDIAVGFEAGYATGAPVTVPLAFDEGLYGFEGFAAVLKMIIQCTEKGAGDLKTQVKNYGLVV